MKRLQSKQWQWMVLGGVTLALVGCGMSRPAWVRSSLESSTPEFQKDFELVELRCTQCHSLDELKKLHSKKTTRDDWSVEVWDMKDREGSKIRADEVEKLTDLLFAWSQETGK